MATSLIGTLLTIAAVIFAFFLFLVVILFVGFGAVKLIKSRKAIVSTLTSTGFDFASVSKVNLLDGVNSDEQKILLDLFSAIGSDGLRILCEWLKDHKKTEQASELKTKLAEVLKN
jgi:hypothetical protein